MEYDPLELPEIGQETGPAKPIFLVIWSGGYDTPSLYATTSDLLADEMYRAWRSEMNQMGDDDGGRVAVYRMTDNPDPNISQKKVICVQEVAWEGLPEDQDDSDSFLTELNLMAQAPVPAPAPFV